MQNLEKKPPHHHMNLGGEGLNDDDMPALLERLNKDHWITSLDVSLNLLGPKGAACLASLKHITELDISYNNIGRGADEDVKGAIDALAKSNIRVLNLCSNNINNESATTLAGMVSLRSLDVSCNLDIEDKGLIALVGNPGIRELSLSCKGFKEGQSFSLFNQAVIDAILKNNTLEKLILFDIEILPLDVQENLKKLPFFNQVIKKEHLNSLESIAQALIPPPLARIVMQYLDGDFQCPSKTAEELTRFGLFSLPKPNDHTSPIFEAAAPENSSADFSHKS
jgi:hypothetical protein